MAESPRRDPMPMTFKPHPWHGIPIGPKAPEIVTAYIEIVPTDTVKYEIDKVTGYLKVDRPQKYSNVCPSLYGLIPRTLCAERVGEFCSERAGRKDVPGDGDPMDVCVLSERNFTHGNFLLRAVPIGGLRMLDKGQADDKIIAVLDGDVGYGSWKDIEDCPKGLIERLRHYFLTYKEPPGAHRPVTEILDVYDAAEARLVIERSREDYRNHFPGMFGAE